MATETAPSERTIRISLVCEGPPMAPSIEFGLQDRAGQLQPGEPGADGSLRFDAVIRAVTRSDGSVTLLGDVVHGPPAGRFLYLSTRQAPTPHAPWISRNKVPLTGVDTAADSVRGRVRASGGGAVPLLGDGWTPLKR